LKNAMDAARSRTGRLTKILVGMGPPGGNASHKHYGKDLHVILPERRVR
jgi:hypothetical protein